MSDSHDEIQDDTEGWHNELVAYLDGEVSPSDRERIEQRLSDDEAYRATLVELERSWRLLDRLPTAEHDQDFTKSTIAMVTAELTNSVTAKQGERNRLPWSKLSALVAAGVLGFLVIVLPARNRQTDELRDLPVAQNLELYRYMDSVGLLRLIRDSNAFATVASTVSADDSPSNRANDIKISWNHTSSVDQIRAGVEQLDASEKRQLSSLRDRFHQLPDEEQTRMRILHQTLVDDPDSQRLFETLTEYREWLTTIPAAERADLLDIQDPAERVAAINNLRQSELSEWATDGGPKLTREDHRAVVRFVHDYVQRNEERIINRLPTHLQRKSKDSFRSPFRDTMLWLATLQDRPDVKFPKPSEESLRHLEQSLSPEVLKEWQAKPAGIERYQLIGSWLKQAMQRMRFAASPEELEEFYLESLTSAQRDALKQLPPEEMREQLRRRFLQDRAGGGRGPRGPGSGPGGQRPGIGPRGGRRPHERERPNP